MSDPPRNGFGTAATYQSVIIALVAACILTATIMSLAYRRRRRRMFLLQVARARERSGGGEDARWLEMEDGTMVHIRGRRKKRKDVGDKPRFWDFELGNEKIEGGEEEDDLEADGDVGLKGKGPAQGSVESRGEVDVSGRIGNEWNPVHAAIHPFPTSSSSTHLPRPNVSMSVLIAMPTPRTAIRDSTLSRSSSNSSLSYQKQNHLDDYSIMRRIDPDLEELPIMELGSIDIPLNIRKEDKEDWSGIVKDVNSRNKENAKSRSEDVSPPDNDTLRVDRVDGFRL